MSNLRPCKSCGNQLAKTADTCPSCGAKTLGRNPGVIIVAILLCAALGGYVIYSVVDARHRAEQASSNLIQIQQQVGSTSP